MVAPAVAGALIGGVTSIFGGLFGRSSQKKADAKNNAAAADAARVARENQISDFLVSGERTRAAAESGGYNPLTFLGATGGAPGFSGGTASAQFTPPLASIAAITGGIREASKAFTGEAAQEQRLFDVQTDLAKIRLDQVRAEIAAATAATKVASMMPSLGNQVRATRRGSLDAVAESTKNPEFFTLGESVEAMPPTSAPILTKGMTWFGDLYYPGADGEPWGIDELLTAAVSVPFNIGLRGIKGVRDKVDSVVFPNGPLALPSLSNRVQPRPRQGRNPAIK